MNNNELFKSVDDTIDSLKKVLEQDYGRIFFVEQKDSTDSASFASENIHDHFEHFVIAPGKTGLFPVNLNSPTELNDLKSKILDRYSKFLEEFEDYAKRTLDQLKQSSPQQAQSLGIIFKLAKNRKKNLEASINRFAVKEGWNLDEISKQISLETAKALGKILEEIIPAISTGIKVLPVMYIEILRQLNAMLSDIGVTTRELKQGVKLTGDEDWRWVYAQNTEDSATKDTQLKDTIKQVLSLPYQLGNNVKVLEGQVVLWTLSN